jgi:hypothetical protein
LRRKLFIALGVLAGALAVVVIERRTGWFSSLLKKIPGLKSLVAEDK